MNNAMGQSLSLVPVAMRKGSLSACRVAAGAIPSGTVLSVVARVKWMMMNNPLISNSMKRLILFVSIIIAPFMAMTQTTGSDSIFMVITQDNILFKMFYPM